MAFNEGWAALNMEMPPKVPRTEYSVTSHWDLVSAVTGIRVTNKSGNEVKNKAGKKFMQVWNFSLLWSVDIVRGHLTGRKTSMGHAVYAADGVDYDSKQECPFSSPEEVLAFDPVAEFGKIDINETVKYFEKQYAEKCESYPDAVNMGGVYITMFSGLIDIFGWDMLLTAGGVDPDGFGQVAKRYEKWITPFFTAYANSDIPVMMVHDDLVWTSGAVFCPDWYRKYIFPAFKRMWEPVLESGKRLIFTSDGNYTEFFPDIVAAGAHTLVMEPCSDMAAFASKYGKTHGFIGNADTRILLSGTKEQIRAEVKRCLDIGKGCPGFIMAVGNHIPANTPVENAIYYNEVYEELAKR